LKVKRVERIVRALARNPKTSAAGLAALCGVGLAAIENPRVLAEPASWVAILTALGLLAAADGGGGRRRPRGKT
jgi:hypothetical protein